MTPAGASRREPGRDAGFEAHARSWSNLFWMGILVAMGLALLGVGFRQQSDRGIVLSLSGACAAGALCFLDLQKRSYLLSGWELTIVHPVLGNLRRRYDVRRFTRIVYTSGKGGITAYLHRQRGLPISLPVLGTVPGLLRAMNAIHPLPGVQR